MHENAVFYIHRINFRALNVIMFITYKNVEWGKERNSLTSH
jgi:hypothetical protein